MFSATVIVPALAAVAAASPFQFPLANGFPNLSPAALAAVETAAGGTLPNTPLPTTLTTSAKTDLQVIATGETFEVAYFSSLLANVTNGVAGYTDVGNKTAVIEILKAIVAQEELHATGANAILESSGHNKIVPCEYTFPVDNYLDAITVANHFTDLVVGALQSVQTQFAVDGGAEASGLVALIGSIIGQEGEQNGVYRLLQDFVPSAAPFLTASSGVYVYNAVAQDFIVPGSCPNASAIAVPAFNVLTPTSQPPPMNSTVTFSTTEPDVCDTDYSIVYMSGQNYPVTVPISDVATDGALTTFSAAFPYALGFSRGLTVAALVKGTSSFTSIPPVVAATVAGPGLIEVH